MTATPTLPMESLSQLGNVPDTYQHEWKLAKPAGAIVVQCGVFKWYHVHSDGAVITDATDAAARDFIAEGAAEWNLSYGLNIALLHQTRTLEILIVGVWRGHNELWTRIYIQNLATGGPFERTIEDGEDAPVACVWELGVVCHERMAWHRYLFTERDETAKRAWLEDVYAGTV